MSTNTPTPVYWSNLTTIVTPTRGDTVAKTITHQSMTFFAVLIILFLCVLVISFLLSRKVAVVPESLAVMILGASIGVLLKFVIGPAGVDLKDWKDIESFHPDTFFLVLLPPIIFESGYTLQKGDFFSNIGAILTYALLGTLVSAVIVGLSMYGLGQLDLVFKLTLMEALAFGSLISATDPVCTLALFQSMNVDQDLYAIVFGESVLNDAVSIVLTIARLRVLMIPFMYHGDQSYSHGTLVGAAKQIKSGAADYTAIALGALSKFCLMLFVSALIGVIFGLLSAIVLKYIHIGGHPSLEIVIVIMFAYMPYGLSEGLELSGIMAILLCGITMSHYTHFNLTPLSQISIQQIFRCLALIAETLVFVYLGMAICGSRHVFDAPFVFLGLVACLIARAIVIFPLSLFFIFCRPKENRVSLKILALIWFSGLRGAVAFAQSLNIPVSSDRAGTMIMTTTLAITVITNVVFGGLTLPLVKLFKVQRGPAKGKSFVSKSLGLGQVIGPSAANVQMSQYRERTRKGPMSLIRGWRRFDKKYLIPFFIREPEAKEYQEAVSHMLGRWVANEERAVGLMSSTEIEEFAPLLVSRTRRNIIRPVRRALRVADDVVGVGSRKSEDESDSALSPIRRHDSNNPFRRVSIPENPVYEETEIDDQTVIISNNGSHGHRVQLDDNKPRI